MKDVDPLSETLGIRATLEQMIKVLGFQDISSFVLASVFLLLAITFAISCAIFLVKKRKERLESLNKLVSEIQNTASKDADEGVKAPFPLKISQEVKPVVSLEEKPLLEEELSITKTVAKPRKDADLNELLESKPVNKAVEDETAAPKNVEEPIAKVMPLPNLSDEQDLNRALKNTRMGFIQKLTGLFSRPEIREEDFEEIEAILFSADIGVKTAQKLLEILKERVRKERKTDKAFLQSVLKEEICRILESASPSVSTSNESPKVLMFVGVNGAGKTTSIGKLGAQLKNSGKSVLLGAGDTFRAAANLQLSIWGERIGALVISGEENADSASVLFQAIQKGKDEHMDYVLCDTAGRLHTKISLMDELKKVYRVVGKAHHGAPHEVLLVIDATMGQNALSQAREFALATPLTGVVLSKLDGTAKGGIAIGIVDELKVPIRYIGIGEKVSDLKDFDAKLFVNALFAEA